MKSAIEKLRLLVRIAKELGLSERDLYNAEEFIKYLEFELSFDTLVTQLYEYDIEINNQVYALIASTAKQLKLSKDKYAFMAELIRSDQQLSKLLADELDRINIL